MNADSNEIELDRRALAVSVWENEGGSRAPDTPDGQFGRGVEVSLWTIYHVFTGIPARVDGSALTDLRSAATDGLLWLNLCKRQTPERAQHPPEIGLETSQTACQS
jgi:hypothetical protein